MDSLFDEPLFRKGFFSDYPDTPRFKYGGEEQRMIFDRNVKKREARSDWKTHAGAAPGGGGPDSNEPDPDLFS